MAERTAHQLCFFMIPTSNKYIIQILRTQIKEGKWPLDVLFQLGFIYRVACLVFSAVPQARCIYSSRAVVWYERKKTAWWHWDPCKASLGSTGSSE